MSVETPQVSADLINQAFIDRIDSGHVKEAEEHATQYIRRKLYENGILRRLFSSRTISAEELDPEVESDKPSIIVEKEPDAPKATFVPFKGTGDRRYFEGVRFRIPFGKVESDRQSKSKFELMTIRMPIMDWLKENMVKQIQQTEDELFLRTLDEILTDNAANQTASVATSSGNIKNAMVEGMKGLASLRLPSPTKVLMHANTYYDSLMLKTDDVGLTNQDRRYQKGLEGEENLLGIPVVTTIKDDLVAPNELYFFAPQDFFCKFYFIQDATLYMKTEADMIQFHSYESVGFGVGNTTGVFKVTLT